MTDTGWYRLGALSGILGIILYASDIVILGSPPAPDSTSLKIAQDIHSHWGALLACTILFTLGSRFFLWFVSAVRTALAEGEGGRRTLANTFFASAVAAAILAALGFVPFAAGAFKLADTTGAQLAARAGLLRMLYDFGNILALVSNGLFAIGVFAAAVVVVRSHALPAWLGWMSAVTAVLAALSLGGIAADSGPFATGEIIFILGFLAFAVWTIGIAVALFRNAVTTSTPATTPTRPELVGQP